ncbi:MAG: spore maturation protein [Clostridiales bacterium]|nr:spore maturation protein [Clostridiales bacterium]
MQLLLFLSDLMVPMVFVVIILFGISKKVPLFTEFTNGAKEGFATVLQIMPTLIGLMVAVGILRASGALDILSGWLAPLTDLVGFPKEALPITFMRLVSSSASTGLLLDVFKNFGPDSFIGRFVSVMMSCTETIFYTMSVYFLSVKITKTKYTLAGALIANFAGVIASIYITAWVFGK